jgi:mono/diheme cytochrome c family protein
MFGRVQFDEAAVQRGKQAFGTSCGFCHGPDARGTGAGPDLGRSLLILSDEKGHDLGQFLQVGRPDRGMPAFLNLTSRQIEDVATFLHSQVQIARSRGSATMNILVGDPKEGEAYFKGPGNCASCHSVTGNLKGVGSKYDPVTLQDTIVSPRNAGRRYTDPTDIYPRKAEVTVSGTTYSGTLVYLSEFAVTLIDQSGERISFRRDGEQPEVVVRDPLQAHQDLLTKYSDKNIHDLTAYLARLK